MNNSLEHILRLPRYIRDGIVYHLSGSVFTAKPRMIQFPVCDRCNARCIMCNRWQKSAEREISLEDIRKVFKNDLFSKVEDVNLHGGEPTLRKDLAEICKTLQDACPAIKRMWISTNGFGPKRIEKRVREILTVVDFGKINSLEINVSIDGLENTHEKIRGVKGGFKQSIETIQTLLELSNHFPLKVTMGTVIQPLNIGEIDAIEQLGRNLGVSVFFQPLMFAKFFNIEGATHLTFARNDLENLKRLIETKFAKGFSTTSFYWCDFLSMMDGANRRSPCAFDRYVFSLYPTGEVLPCSREDWIIFGNIYEEAPDEIWFGGNAKKVRDRMKREVCPTCSSYCGVEFSLQKEFFTYLGFYLRRTASSVKSLSIRKRPVQQARHPEGKKQN